MRRWWRARPGHMLRDDLDDDHTTTAARARWTRRRQRSGVLIVVWCWRGEQFPGTRDICLAGGAGKKAVVTDAVEAFRQNVEQKAADELIRAEGHGALALGAVAAIVLVAEGDAGLVDRDQPMVRDCNAVGISRQIGRTAAGPEKG